MKRAQIQKATVVAILAAIVLMILLVFAYNYITAQREREPEQICQLSIFKALQLKRLPGEVFSPLDCPRSDLVIKKSDIVENDRINQEKASKIIAEGMRRCWNMVGEGRADPFSNWDTQGQSYCLICKQIVFDRPLKKFIGESMNSEKVAKERGIDGFIQSPLLYLAETKVPGKEKSYWQYLYNSEPRLQQSDFGDISKSVVEDNSVIMVNMYKTEEKSTLVHGTMVVVGVTLSVTGGILSATGVGAIIGAPLIKWGVGLTAAGIVAYATLVPIVENAYSDCEECKGVGGIGLLPPGVDLTQKISTTIDGEEKDIPICSLLVN